MSTSFADKAIPLDKREWTTKFLVVKYPATSLSAGNWRMGRTLVNRWLAAGVLRIEGTIPELALAE